MAALTDALSGHKSLQTLNLSGNNIGDARASQVSNLIEQLPKLKELDLGQNNITSSGAIAISKGLLAEGISKLKILPLRVNKIGDEGAMHISKALENHKFTS